MARIKIIDGFEFDYDDKCYTLYHTFKKELKSFGDKKPTGEFKECTVEVGYFPKLRFMLERVIQLATKEKAEIEGIETVGEYVEICKGIEKSLKNLLKEY